MSAKNKSKKNVSNTLQLSGDFCPDIYIMKGRLPIGDSGHATPKTLLEPETSPLSLLIRLYIVRYYILTRVDILALWVTFFCCIFLKKNV